MELDDVLVKAARHRRLMRVVYGLGATAIVDAAMFMWWLTDGYASTALWGLGLALLVLLVGMGAVGLVARGVRAQIVS